tara:strand:+ start:433 stop:762 length:330 start_codon:yes stop_codon:yes gene_type:complete
MQTKEKKVFINRSEVGRSTFSDPEEKEQLLVEVVKETDLIGLDQYLLKISMITSHFDIINYYELEDFSEAMASFRAKPYNNYDHTSNDQALQLKVQKLSEAFRTAKWEE